MLGWIGLFAAWRLFDFVFHPIFMVAVHPTHAVRPIGCRAPKDVAVAIEPGSGLDRLTIHGAIDLETGRTIM